MLVQKGAFIINGVLAVKQWKRRCEADAPAFSRLFIAKSSKPIDFAARKSAASSANSLSSWNCAP
ncbi:hypothetical protein ACFYE9_35975 [Rhizobium leguminosarum]|uniref:Uncharacterized protein n=2 Tax=Rhizobium leguminosarum TaxID=384 RepID=A0A154IMS3_RHILE|nr:hypothetical protein [Rhizobium leguminosarum]KZB01813.1 hypothetical protein A4A59_12300 [Rhizobium leguminosarum]